MPDKISSCPTSYPADYSQELRVYTSKCEKVLGQLSYFHEYAEECLRVYCAWEWQTDIISYIGANETKWETGTWIQWSGAFSTGISTTVVTSQTRWTSTTTRVMAPSDAVKPKAPCCGTCELHAGTVGLYYWPDSKTASNATAAPTGVPLPGKGTYVDEAGFTFVSPSVYIAFTSLGARNRCGDVGNPVYNMTMAFDLTELSSVLPHVKTASCPTVYPNGDPVTYAETSIPPPVPLTLADVAQNCSSIEGYYYDPDHLYNAGAGDPCHPVIAIPDRVKQFQPEWENCGANYYGGFYDPPRALKQAQFIDSTTASEAPTSATPGPSNPTVAPPTSLLVPSIPQESSPVDNPDPSSSGPDLPDPPASSLPGNQPESPASTPSGQPNPVDPPLGSSTILIIPPGPSESQPEQPPANMPPVITLPPNPTNPSDPGQIISVIPTTLPSNPNGPQGSVSSGIAVAIGSTTLTPGQVITIGGTTTTNANGETTVVSGTPVSIDPQGTQLIVDGTSTIPLTTPAQTTTGPPLVVTLGSTTLTANSKTQFVFESTTLSMGGAPVIVSGTTYVMTTNAQGSTELVIGTGGANSTIAPASTTGPSVSEFTGGAAVGLKKTVEVVVTVVLVAVLMG